MFLQVTLENIVIVLHGWSFSFMKKKIVASYTVLNKYLYESHIYVLKI